MDKFLSLTRYLMMINDSSYSIWDDPTISADITNFKNNVRKYWKSNVKKHFSKRENNYGGLQPKLNHRFLITPFGANRSPRLQNALVIRWTPESNHINVNVASIMVKAIGSEGHESGIYNINKDTRYGPNQPKRENYQQRASHGTKAYDLIDLLSKGTRTSKGRYRVRYDCRVASGERKGTSGAAWDNWFTEFLSFVDGELERLADKIEEVVERQLFSTEELE